MPPEFAARVLVILQQLPAGRVTTYGALAAQAGYPRHARHVGRLLRELPDHSGLPWFRVINASGRVARPGTPEADWQRLLLEADGIELSANGSINLRHYGWPDGYFGQP